MRRPLFQTCVAGLLALSIATLHAAGILGVGTTNSFPPAIHSGAKISFALWAWNKNPDRRRRLLGLTNGLAIPASSLPHSLQILFRIHTPHDTVRSLVRSSDAFTRIGWGPQRITDGPSPKRWYHALAEWDSFFPQVGRYCAEAEGYRQGKSVAMRRIHFRIVNRTSPPRDTAYLKGKTDCFGNPITGSKPVNLPPLNQTPKLIDNDYPFEPQHAYNVINFERFPPFHLPRRFILVWNSRRFTDEDRFGGPLNRGFNVMATVMKNQDNLPIRQRAWFHTPDLQVHFIRQWVKKDPKRYADLKGYADYRSPWVSAAHAYKLGWQCYSAWGAAGWGPYDAGLYGFDEEQMWYTRAENILRSHPELVPAPLRRLRQNDPQVKKPATLRALHRAYIKAWGDFIGNYYRGARACAASRGRAIQVWHYGSKAPGDDLFQNRDGARIDPATGRYRANELDHLWPWFKNGNRISFNASAYARQIDFFQKDFYYQTIFPQYASMYERDANGQYRLDSHGRRIIRHDLFQETVYARPVKIGYEDCEISPVFLKSFVAKGENALYWLNGGHYYKTHGTLMTDKQLIPTLRPGDQETWGRSARLGSRPVSPYLAEATVIYTFMTGLEGLYYWDSRGFTGPAGYGPPGDLHRKDILGDIEFAIKGLHRLSEFNTLFQGHYSFIRPVCCYDSYDRDNPLIRGILNGRYLLLAMTNPYLDPGQTQKVELWYHTDHAHRAKYWHDTVTLHARKTPLLQCKLPPLPDGRTYDPDDFYFRYTCHDGDYHKTYTVTGNYTRVYPYGD